MEFFNQQFRNSNPQPTIWEQFARFRYGFIAGLLVGVLFGWFFHGVVSVVVRLGILALLLIPLIIIGWLYFRFRGSGSESPEQRAGARVITIGNMQDLFRPNPAAPPAEQPQPKSEAVIELDESEYDLETFKKRLEKDL